MSIFNIYSAFSGYEKVASIDFSVETLMLRLSRKGFGKGELEPIPLLALFILISEDWKDKSFMEIFE